MNIKRLLLVIPEFRVKSWCFLVMPAIIVFLIMGCEAKVEPEIVNISTEKDTISLTLLTNDLKRPWSLAVMPKGDLLITEKSGLLKRYDYTSGKIDSVKGVPEVVDRHRGGLFDVVLHPEFDKKPWVYLSYSVRIAEKQYALRLGRGRLKGNSISEWEVLFTSLLSASPVVRNPKHFGGGLTFGLDGYLYMSLGDRFSRPRVQESTNYIGKVIRLHDDGRIPEDNPWKNSSKVLPEIYSSGLRNPQSMTVDNRGRVWLVDHGPLGGDELNLVSSKANFGWPVITGGTEYDGRIIGEGAAKDGVAQPILTWPESVAPSGVTFYGGEEFPHWKDNLFISFLLATQIKRLEIKEGKVVHEEILLQDKKIRFRDIIAGLNGYIYILTEDGRLFEMSPNGEVDGKK